MLIKAFCAVLTNTEPAIARPRATPPTWATRVSLKSNCSQGGLTDHHEADGIVHVGRIYDRVDDGVAELDKGSRPNAKENFKAVDSGFRSIRVYTGCVPSKRLLWKNETGTANLQRRTLAMSARTLPPMYQG